MSLWGVFVTAHKLLTVVLQGVYDALVMLVIRSRDCGKDTKVLGL